MPWRGGAKDRFNFQYLGSRPIRARRRVVSNSTSRVTTASQPRSCSC
jgi:hypothetical protein